MTLYLTPVVYTYMAGLLSWRKERAAPPMPAPAAGLGFAD
jgi:hypothetical protein